MKRILLVYVCVMSFAWARFTSEEIAEEAKAYQKIEPVLYRQAQEMMDEMTNQAKEVERLIAVPFQTPIDALQENSDSLCLALDGLKEKANALRDKRQQCIKQLEDVMNQRLINECNPLREQLELQRKPILSKIESLMNKQKQAEDRHIGWQQSNFGRYLDWIDYQDCEWRIAAFEDKIKGLYESVDGDLPKRIFDISQNIEAKFKRDSSEINIEYDNQ